MEGVMGSRFPEIGSFVQILIKSIFIISVLSPSFSLGVSPEESRISCFLIGSIQANICPLPGFFKEDPLFFYEEDPHQAGLTLEQRIRHDRLYFPRSRARLLEKFDMVFFADPYIDHFTPRQFGDLHFAFTRSGMPSYWSFGPAYGNVIQTTILADILPISDYQGYFHKPWFADFRRDREAVFTPFIELGMERIPGEAYAWMRPRIGSVIWADMRPLDMPWIVSWRPGQEGAGLTWVFADEFNLQWWGLASGSKGVNPFSLEMMVNMILFSLDRDLISNIFARREARHQISAFRNHKLLIISMLEWADMFGANTFSLSKDLKELDSKVDVALQRYLTEDFEASVSLTKEAFAGLDEIGKGALELKNQALYWVFLIEWMVVTGAAVIGGVVLWTLMVRRRMYRQVTTTRVSALD
jgi:hypothetical protein